MRHAVYGGLLVFAVQPKLDARRRIARPAGRESVCLITPPSAFLLDERVFVSLGVLKVAGSLEARGYAVNFLDLSGIENFISALTDYLATSQDRAIGITTTTPQLPAVMKIAATIRARKPDLKVILGGLHVTLVYSALKVERKRGISGGRAACAAARLEAAFDVLCSGDGELAIFAALGDDAPKVVDGDDPKGRFFLSDAMFTDLPTPARHLRAFDKQVAVVGGNPSRMIGRHEAVHRHRDRWRCRHCNRRPPPVHQ